MKNIDMNLFDNDDEFFEYRDEPEWFKQSLVKACRISSDGKSISHMDSIDSYNQLLNKQPIVTTLKYIRSITLDSNDHIGNISKPNFPNIDLDTCIILIPENTLDFIEPISNLKVSGGGLEAVSDEELCCDTIDEDRYLMLDYCHKIIPFGYANEEIIKMWKENTIPYKEEVLQHLNDLQNVTKDNFGVLDIETDEIISTIKSSLKYK